MRALFISDLHLCEARADLYAAFFALLNGPAREVERLYILGDLFDYWVGDDDDDPAKLQVGSTLRALADRGTGIYFMAGNRDFLIGNDFATRAGMRILPDPSVIELDGTRILLAHGDAQCTDDTAYQAFRNEVRTRAWQDQFLARPLTERKAIVDGMRAQSSAATAGKNMDIMDVNPGAIASLLREHGTPPHFIHGHTHRPARHEHTIDGHTCIRHVLPDWRTPNAPHLLWTGTTFQPGTFPPSNA